MKKIFKVIFTIIGTVIGAGFASGQEIYLFFNQYKEIGLIGLIISNILTGLIIYLILKKSNKMKLSSYKDLLKGTKLSENKINIFNTIVNMFLLISFYIMVAGFATYFNEQFKIPKFIMILITVFICYITFIKRVEGITKINNIIVPILIVIILFMGSKINILNEIVNVKVLNMNNIKEIEWLLKSIEYASYNSILLIPMLISIRKYSIDKEKSVSVISTTFLLILSTVVFLAIYKYQSIVKLSDIEMPMIYISNEIGKAYKYIYGIVIIFSIYSTMISAGYGLLENVEKKSYAIFNKLICITAILVANISFSELVKISYPIFGILGIIQLIYVLK